MAQSIPQACTLILGAGVSAPYGLPLGPTLVNDIVDLNREACAGVLKCDVSEIVTFQKALRGSQVRSIDAFSLDYAVGVLPWGVGP